MKVMTRDSRVRLQTCTHCARNRWLRLGSQLHSAVLMPIVHVIHLYPPSLHSPLCRLFRSSLLRLVSPFSIVGPSVTLPPPTCKNTPAIVPPALSAITLNNGSHCRCLPSLLNTPRPRPSRRNSPTCTPGRKLRLLEMSTPPCIATFRSTPQTKPWRCELREAPEP